MANLGDFTWLCKAKHTVHLTFVTTYGLTVNVYSGHIRSCITADDLFKISEWQGCLSDGTDKSAVASYVLLDIIFGYKSIFYWDITTYNSELLFKLMILDKILSMFFCKLSDLPFQPEAGAGWAWPDFRGNPTSAFFRGSELHAPHLPWAWGHGRRHAPWLSLAGHGSFPADLRAPPCWT